MKSERLDNLDLIKALAICLVILLHTQIFNFDFISNFSINNLLNYCIRLILEGVPFFVFINGYLLFKKKTLDIKKHYKKLLKIFLLIVIWGTILTFSGYLIANRSLVDFKYLIKNTLAIKVGNDYNGIIWFLQSLLNVYLLYPILLYIYNNNYQLYKYILIVLCFFTIGINFLDIINNLLNSIININIINDLILFIERFNPLRNEWFLLYFLISGFVLKNNDYFAKHKNKMFIIGLLSWLLSCLYGIYMSFQASEVFQEWFNSNSVFMIFIIIGLFTITINYRNNSKIKSIICSIGQNTLGIYFYHYILLFVKWKYQASNAPLSIKISWFFFILIGSYLLTLISKKIPILKELIKT